MRYFSATFFYIIISTGYLMAVGSDSSSSSGSSSGGGGVSYSSDSSEGPDNESDQFRAVKALIYTEKYVEAYENLTTLVVKKNEDDRQNLLGFTARKSGNYKKAAKHYEAALKLNPKHLGALEYQGELFIALGEYDKAETNLNRIKNLCWLYSKEKTMLAKALKVAKTN